MAYRVAERRLGEMMAEQRETFGTAQGQRTDLGYQKTQVTPRLRWHRQRTSRSFSWPAIAPAGDIGRDTSRFVAREQTERAGRAHIKIVAGDAVVVEISRYDLTSGRIIFPI